MPRTINDLPISNASYAHEIYLGKCCQNTIAMRKYERASVFFTQTVFGPRVIVSRRKRSL